MLVGPLTTNASTFTSLKAQLEYISNQIANFTSDVKGEVLGATSGSINIISPNGGQVFKTQELFTITWSSTLPSNSKLEIWLYAQEQYGSSASHITTKTLSISSYNAKMPYSGVNGIYGNFYKIHLKVYDPITSQLLAEDFSDNTFSLYPLHCYNGIQDGDETGVNIGPSCAPVVSIQPCPVGSVGIAPNCATSSIYTAPRIAYWYGKVNQHFDLTSKTWQSDPDGVSGSFEDQLTYCKKWYPATVSVKPYKSETIYTWKPVISEPQFYYTQTVTSTECVKGNFPQCDYPVPPKNCSYIQGPNYNPSTNCGLVLDCKVVVDDEFKLINTDTSSSKVVATNNFCAFTFTKNLGYGNVDTNTSKDVSYLQSVLVDEKLLPSPAVTGKFYAQTQTALKNFQKKYKLAQTGKVDANTRIKLNSLFQDYCNNI